MKNNNSKPVLKTKPTDTLKKVVKTPVQKVSSRIQAGDVQISARKKTIKSEQVKIVKTQKVVLNKKPSVSEIKAKKLIIKKEKDQAIKLEKEKFNALSPQEQSRLNKAKKISEIENKKINEENRILKQKQTQELKKKRAIEVIQEKKNKEKIRIQQKQEKKDLKKSRVLQSIRDKKNKAIKNKYSSRIIKGEIISTTQLKPNLDENIIELKKVKKAYLLGSTSYPVLRNVELEIKKGDFIVILGPSGSGKTTLLNVISGLDTVDSGDIFVDGYNIALLKDKHLTEFRRQKIGFVFQQYNLLPHLTAKENAEVGANLNRSKTNIMTIKDIFKMIWMEDHYHKFPYQLSGGQQQRISIARALAKQPSILFCDEPTGALDENTGRVVLDVLVNINKKSKTTVIIVTHNPNIALIANAVIKISNGEITEFYKNKNKLLPKDISWS